MMKGLHLTYQINLLNEHERFEEKDEREEEQEGSDFSGIMIALWTAYIRKRVLRIVIWISIWTFLCVVQYGETCSKRN